MSGEDNSSSEFHNPQRSDEVRAAAQAPRRIATAGRPSPTRRPPGITTVQSSSATVDQRASNIPSPNRGSGTSPYYHHQSEITTDDSFDERFSTTPSWEDAASFDSEEHRSKPPGRPHDRRKQFDSTTPTLIDEEEEDEDDSEMLQLQRSFDQGKDTEMRRTPGASKYKSTLDLSQDDSSATHVRRTPGASAMHRSGTTVGSEVAAPVVVRSSSSGAVDNP